MKHALQQLVGRGAACALLAGLAWKFVGPTVLPLSGALFGLVLAKPLLELGSELFDAVRELAYRDVDGHYYAYRGTPLRVIEDEQHVRWLRMVDVRAVLGPGASDGALAALHGEQSRRIGGDSYLSAEALLEQLSRDTRAEAGRFRHWLEREVAFPARQLRARAVDTQA